jgi:hypothetical protein
MLALIGVAIYGSMSLSANAALQREIEAAQQRGEPVYLADFKPEGLVPQQNAAPLLEKAISALVEPSDDFYESLTEPPVVPADVTPLREGLAANQRALDLLEQALARPYCWFELEGDFEDWIEADLDRFQGIRNFSRLLTARALLAMAEKKPDVALRAILDQFALAETLDALPMYITQLVRDTLLRITLDQLSLLLAQASLTPEQLQELDRRLAHQSETYSLQRCVYAERAWFTDYLKDLQGFTLPLFEDDDSLNWLENQYYSLHYNLRPSVRKAQAQAFPLYSKIAELIDQPGPEARTEIERIVQDAAAANPIVELIGIPGANVWNLGAFHRAMLDRARLALRVDHYRDRHGHLPTSLEQVLDATLAEIPTDFETGLPLRYQVLDQGLDHGFVICSPDPDAVDAVFSLPGENEPGRRRYFVVNYSAAE